MLPRFHRRLVVLRGKRGGAFDPDQYYLEGAARARVRRLRVALRRHRPVLLRTPPWSRPLAFLDDVAVDLLVEEPAIDLRFIALRAAPDSTEQQRWRSLAEKVIEACESQTGSGGQGSSGRARFAQNEFALAVQGALAEGPPQRCVVVVALEALPDPELRELLELVAQIAGVGANLVIASPLDVDLAQAPFIGLHLDDFGEEEAIEALVEQAGPQDPARLEALAAVSGGIPAVLEGMAALAARAEPGALVRETVWRALGETGREIAAEWTRACGDPSLRERLRWLVAEGPQPWDLRDPLLVRAGLVRTVGGWTSLRAPLLRDLP